LPRGTCFAVNVHCNVTVQEGNKRATSSCMSILQYFSRDGYKVGFPDPNCVLSGSIPPTAIESANAELTRYSTTSRQPIQLQCYNNYTPKPRATIGKFAAEN
jgi:hypothetical protein